MIGEFNTIDELKIKGQWDGCYFSAPGLLELVKTLGNNILGLEIGACRGANGVKFLEGCSNIMRLDLIDPYKEYKDSAGYSSQLILDQSKEVAFYNFAPFGDRARLHVCTSDEYVKTISDGYYDYIFIDGNHSYECVKNDMINYYPKVKTGGIFSGHDVHLNDVQRALLEFRSIVPDFSPMVCSNNVWYWYKK